MKSKEFSFTFVIKEDSRRPEDWLNALYEAGGADTTARVSNGVHLVSFDREANSLEEAIRSAWETLRAAGLQPIRCEIEDETLAEAFALAG